MYEPQATVDRTPAANRDRALDSLRGLAAVSVALGHCVLAVTGIKLVLTLIGDLSSLSFTFLIARFLHVLFPAGAAVTVFFVLSGHVLWRSFDRRLPAGSMVGRLAGLPDYAVARAYRLLPSVAAATLPLAWWLNAPGRMVVENIFLVRTDLNGVTWTLQVELMCSLALFLLHRVVAGRWWAIACVLPANIWLAYNEPMSPIYGAILFFPAFILGALLDRIPRWLWRYPTILAGLIIASLGGLIHGAAAPARAMEIVGATAVVGGVRALQPPFLLNRPMLFLGRISYPLYLSHGFGMLVTWPSVHAIAGSHIFVAIALLIISSLAVAIPLATVIHYLVEQPLMKARAHVPSIGQAWMSAAAVARPAFRVGRSVMGAVERVCVRLGLKTQRPRVAVPTGEASPRQ